MATTNSSQVIIITGAGTGIGQDTARRFHQKGAAVVLNGRREDKLKETAALLGNERVAYVAGDIAKPETSQKLVEVAVKEFGGLDVLVNNAGIFKPTPFLEHRPEDVNAYLDIIFKGTFFASQAAVPALKARGKGAIVNVGSMWATIAVNATPSAAYSGAKAAVHALTKNLALELAADKIRVNAVAPAVVETPVYGTFLSDAQVKEVLPTFNGFHPLGRNGQPKDVAAAIEFLASNEADWITGAILALDGGVTAGRHA